MNKQLLPLLSAGLLSLNLAAERPANILWAIGKADNSAAEFALAPDGYKQFLANDFGYEDKYYIIGVSNPKADFPYVLPGPADTWGGTWPTSGWRTHQVNVLFDLDKNADKDGYALELDLADYS